MIKRLISNHHIFLWGLFILAFMIRGFGLTQQPALDDEVGVAFNAFNYLKTGLWSRVMWEHPPLRNIIVYVSSSIFGGYSAWGLRFGSVLLGSLSIPLAGYFSHALFRRRLAGFLPALFLCIDPLHISLSREAFQETTTAFFILAGVLSAYHGIKKDNMFLSCVSGILFGVASASKWHGVFPCAASAAAWLAAPWVIEKYEGERRFFLRLSTALVIFAVIPFVVYSLAFVPWFQRGHSLGEFFSFQLFLVRANYAHKAADYAEHFLAKRAYLWFLVPTAWNEFVFSGGKPYLNVAMGNYFVWVLTLPSLFLGVRNWISEKRFESGYLISIFVISYLPLLLTARGIWVLNSLSVIPFAFIISSCMICGLIEQNRITYRMLSCYLAIVIMISGMMYPLSTFRTLDYALFKPMAEMYSPHK